MEYKYIIVVETYHDGQEDRIGYGIAAIAKKSEKEMTIVKVAPDVSPNCAEVRHLIELCNKFELSPIHLYDVVEDFIFC